MTKEIRYIVENKKFKWAPGDIGGYFELLGLGLVGLVGYAFLTKIGTIEERIVGLIFLIIAVLAVGLVIKRIGQLNSFAVIQTRNSDEENYAFCLEQLITLKVKEKDLDKWNFCINAKLSGRRTKFYYTWLTIICFDGKVFINERPEFPILSAWWKRDGFDIMTNVVKLNNH